MNLICCFKPKPVFDNVEPHTQTLPVRQKTPKVLTTVKDVESENKKYGHLYLIKEREFIKTNENIFKIGKSINVKNRMMGYPKDSLIYCIHAIKPELDLGKTERELIKQFDNTFTNRKDIGREYYETPDENSPICEFINFISGL
jgi:hypothetical protein